MKSYIVLLACLLLTNILFAQKDESIAAQVGNDKITAKEFKLRFELSPYIPNDRHIDPDSVKYDFLYSLIAEKLWANEAERMGFASTEKFNFYFQPLKDMFVRDALFKKEVDDKVKLTASDINNGIIKSQVKLNTQLITAKDSLGIYNFYNQLNTKNNFDSLITINKGLTLQDIDVSIGSLHDEEIEDSLYALGINEYTSPIKSEVGWIMFRIKNKVLTPIDLNDQKAIDDIKKKIRERRIEKRFQEYRTELLSGTKININPETFTLAYKSIWNRIKIKPSVNDSANYFGLTETDFEYINSSLNTDDFNKLLFKIGDKNISLKYFLSVLAFDGFDVNRLDSTIVHQKLSRRVKQFVEDQIITQEGDKLNLGLLPEVRNDISKWKQKYLAQFYFNAMFDSVKVTNNELYNYYINELHTSNNLRLVNIRLISLKDLDEVSKILNDLKDGKNFGDVIKNYGQTDSLVNAFGETGLKPILSLGDVGKIASDLKINEVYGPFQRNNSYTILQVIDKKDGNDSVKLSFESIKNGLRNQFRVKQLNENLNKVTSELAEKNKVKIYNDVLKKIKTSNIPMFVHRFMGFGGRIAGMPLVTPFSNWINYTNKKKLFP